MNLTVPQQRWLKTCSQSHDVICPQTYRPAIALRDLGLITVAKIKAPFYATSRDPWWVCSITEAGRGKTP